MRLLIMNLYLSLSLPQIFFLFIPNQKKIHIFIFIELFFFLDLFFNGISGGQNKDCDLPKTTVLHGSNNFGQLQSPNTNDNTNSNNNNNTRLHVTSGGLCDSHNMHQDQVINLKHVPIDLGYFVP